MRANRFRGVAVSEYGAGSNVSHHTETPQQRKTTVCVSHSGGGANIVQGQALRFFIPKRPKKLGGRFVGNMCYFAIHSRNEGGIPGRNEKGFVSYDRRTKKDAYFLYQAYWRTLPVTYITSRRFTERRQATISVKVYSNANAVTLFCNGVQIAERKASQCRQAHVFLFRNVQLQAGENTVTARGDNGAEDTVAWHLEK